jgi:hypothetical protein
MSGIQTTEACDKALSEIAELNRKMNKIEEDTKQKVAALMDPNTQKKVEALYLKAEEKKRPLQESLKVIEGQIATFEFENKETIFLDKKSLSLVCGDIGYRDSTSIQTSDHTVKLLEEQGLGDCIKTIKSVLKDRLKKLGDDVLRTVGAKRIRTERFFYQLHGQKPVIVYEHEEEALKEAA